jgi:thymidylate synthase
MDGARWNSLVHELLWYLSGRHHIRNLREKTGIWDEWADEDGNLDTAYGRFWRKYPVPKKKNQIKGESWVTEDNYREDVSGETYFIDQIQYVIDNLKENPNSRRHVVTAWHPANATVSTLPPCHLMFIFNVQNGDELNLQLTQRSGDIALGIPFNIASYALLQRLIAQETGLKVGKFHHTITDAHIYCGKGERADWWEENIEDLQNNYSFDLWGEIIGNRDIPEQEEPYDHIPSLLDQMNRTSYDLPQVEIDDKSIDDIEYEDIELKEYESHDSIQFEVAK